MTATQPTLDFAGPGRDHGIASTDTERAAAAPDRSDLRRRVLDAFMAAGPGGLTDEEASVQAQIARPHSAAAPS